MTISVVDRLHSEFIDLLSVLDRANEISLRNTADDNFRKSLLLACASHFEHILTQTVMQFVEETANSNILICSFVANKAIFKQYHTWFKWEDKNANHFFGLFGREFLIYMKDMIKKNEELFNGIQAFLELGYNRNRLVHQDYGSFTLEKTSAEIFESYCKAKYFINKMPELFRDFTKIKSSTV